MSSPSATIHRREFLKSGSLATAALTVPLAKAGTASEIAAPQDVQDLAVQHFQNLTDRQFTLRTRWGDVACTVSEVETHVISTSDARPVGCRSVAFSVRAQGNSEFVVPAGTYPVTLSPWGEFRLFVQPTSAGVKSEYEIVFA